MTRRKIDSGDGILTLGRNEVGYTEGIAICVGAGVLINKPEESGGYLLHTIQSKGFPELQTLAGNIKSDIEDKDTGLLVLAGNIHLPVDEECDMEQLHGDRERAVRAIDQIIADAAIPRMRIVKYLHNHGMRAEYSMTVNTKGRWIEVSAATTDVPEDYKRIKRHPLRA